MRDRLNVAVLGAGRIGRIHAETLAWSIPQARLWAVADIDRSAAERLGGRLQTARIEGGAEEILNDPDVEAVVIATSTDTHSLLIEACARAGKHVFCEKPIDYDLQRIDRALNAVAESGVKLQIGFNRRFDPNFRHIRQRISAGDLGDLHILRITSRDPGPPPIEYVRRSGGMFLDMSIHDFDMARYMTGSEARSVYAVGSCRVDPAIAEAGDIDTAIVTMQMQNGCFVTIDNSRKATYGYDQRVEAFGAQGMLWAENQTAHRTGFADGAGLHTPRPLDFFLERYIESFRAELRDFVTAVVADRDPPVSGADGRAPVVLALAAVQSLQSGSAVYL